MRWTRKRRRVMRIAGRVPVGDLYSKQSSGDSRRENGSQYVSVVPAHALGHAHISEAPSCSNGVEVFEAVLHGDGTGRFGRGVAVPAAETADDPGSPGKAVGRMRILEPFAFGFDILIEGSERCDLVRFEREVDRLLAAAIPRLPELA